MLAVGLKVLKNKLAQYVRLAAEGEVILVCDRDRVVAQLAPPQPMASPVLADSMLADWVRHGVMVPALMAPSRPRAIQPVATLAELMADLDSARAERI